MRKPLTAYELATLAHPLGVGVTYNMFNTVSRGGSVPHITWVLKNQLPPPAPGFQACPRCTESLENTFTTNWLCACCGSVAKREGDHVLRVITRNPPGCTEVMAAAFRLGGIAAVKELGSSATEHTQLTYDDELKKLGHFV